MGQPTFDDQSFEAGPSRVRMASDRIRLRISGYQTKVSFAEYIGEKKQTRGTETSKYPEERISKETPLVVASERGSGQCSCEDNWNHLERWAVAGDSPVQVMPSMSLE